MSDAVSPIVLRETFDVDAPPARVWSVVADTDRMNQLVFRTSHVELVEAGRDRARVRGLLPGAEFDELPWVFKAPERFRVERVFHRGPYARMITDVELTPTERGTRVTFAQEVTPGRGLLGLVGRAAIPLAWPGTVRRYRAVLASLGGARVDWPTAFPQAEAVRARARAFVQKIPGGVVDADLVGRLVEHVACGTDADVARIRPYALADEWGRSRREVLTTCLHATKAGLLRLSWDVLCPSCESPPKGYARLQDVEGNLHCALCDVDFGPAFERNIEATFAPSSSVRVVERVMFCLGSPARTKSWIAQLVVAPGAREELSLALGEGRYRVQASGVDGPSLVDVREDGSATLELAIPKRAGERVPALAPVAPPTLRRGDVAIHLVNDDDTPHRVQIAHRAFASDAATAADVTATGLFRDLFGEDALAPNQHLAVGESIILFTDLVGSTAMYEREGDATAYSLVRAHFERLFDVVERHGGHVVKTVGDAVMAAFPSSEAGARAGLDSILAIAALAREDARAKGLALRVGVHRGPCLAVEANGSIDYFGRTVNVAARVEALGGANELVLSESIADAHEIPELLDELKKTHVVEKSEARVKGVDRALVVTRVKVATGSSA